MRSSKALEMTQNQLTDWRGLCEELVCIADALDGKTPLAANQGQTMDGFSALANFRGLADRAREALAQPDPEVAGPTDEELLGIAAQAIEPYDKIRLGEYEAENNCAIEVYGSELIAFARAVLARFGRPAPAPAEGERQVVPVPVAVSERLPQPEDCDAEHYCWRWNTIGRLWARQPLARSWYEFESHWLPANALPLPSGEVEGNKP